MKRLNKKLSVPCLITAALLSLIIGIGLPHIQAFSADMISRMYPVAYQITYRSTEEQPITMPAHLLKNTAIVMTPSGNTAIPLSEAVFVCLQNELRTQNILRSGLLTAIILLAAVCLPSTLIAIAFSYKTCKSRSGSKRHMHTTPQYTTDGSRHTSTVPSAA